MNGNIFFLFLTDLLKEVTDLGTLAIRINCADAPVYSVVQLMQQHELTYC